MIIWISSLRFEYLKYSYILVAFFCFFQWIINLSNQIDRQGNEGIIVLVRARNESTVSHIILVLYQFWFYFITRTTSDGTHYNLPENSTPKFTYQLYKTM